MRGVISYSTTTPTGALVLADLPRLSPSHSPFQRAWPTPMPAPALEVRWQAAGCLPPAPLLPYYCSSRGGGSSSRGAAMVVGWGGRGGVTKEGFSQLPVGEGL